MHEIRVYLYISTPPKNEISPISQQNILSSLNFNLVLSTSVPKLRRTPSTTSQASITMCLQAPTNNTPTPSMAITVPKPLVSHCCGYCCKEEHYGNHELCGWCENTNCL
ncbi:uncharacterized protein L3040_002056 [Drepanopeziza brunnea f. sp. 'multigermtubi']|uniref:uncharacterized protein n=1 Tax=Drepanopeziza brunnea f. sp. 'multigermtubi' TaxID=698441 RepID=UPI00239AAD3F|nr:hypothetical protein L3040_002056 [Drepanopeziza brunnea f. sp. 'multigermtubi']